MPDIAVPYTLVAPGGTIIFNDPLTADQFYITDIPSGLAGAPIRAPMDDVAFGDGGRSYNFWEGARHILVEGMFLVTSVPVCPAAVAIWNEMEETLRAVLRSIAAQDTDVATLTWRPTGQTERQLIVRNDVTLETAPDQNYLARTFHFGLVADDPDWVETT